MIADSLSAYSRAMQMLDQIRKRAEAVDEYIMRLILANSMFGGSVYKGVAPADTPYADFYTQAAMTSLFAPLMREVSLIAGAQPNIDPEPQAEKTSVLVSIPRETATIGDILTRAVAVDTGFSEMHTYTDDTSALADNVANVIRRVGWQFAWPFCKGSVRVSGMIAKLAIQGVSGNNDVICRVGFQPEAAATEWQELHEGDAFFYEDVSAIDVSLGGVTRLGIVSDLTTTPGTIVFELPIAGVVTDNFSVGLGNLPELGFEGFLLRKCTNNPT